MIALARFQMAGFMRSFRFVPPAMAVLLYVLLVLLQWPGERFGRELTVGTYGDTAAVMFPIWAWTARALLDTEPDVQRVLSALAVGRRALPSLAGLLAAYTVNLTFAGLVLAVPLLQGVTYRVGAPAMLAGVALTALVAAAGTITGAWTCRAVIPSAGISVLALLGVPLLVLLMSMGPLDRLSIPMVGWLRAAHDGPAAFVTAFPGVALHTVLWSVMTGAAYVTVRRRLGRP